ADLLRNISSSAQRWIKQRLLGRIVEPFGLMREIMQRYLHLSQGETTLVASLIGDEQGDGEVIELQLLTLSEPAITQQGLGEPGNLQESPSHRPPSIDLGEPRLSIPAVMYSDSTVSSDGVMSTLTQDPDAENVEETKT